MHPKKKSELPDLEDKTVREMKDFASTKEGVKLQKQLSEIDPKKLMQVFSGLDKSTVAARLKGLDAEKIRKALENKDFLDGLK